MAQVNPSLIDTTAGLIVVGGNPGCLFDNSDTTYAEAIDPTNFGSTVRLLMGAASISGLAAFPLYARAMYRLNSGSPPSPIGMTVNADNPDTGESYGFFSSNVAYGFEFAAVDTIYDITDWTWNEDHPGSTADLLAGIAAGELRLSFDSRSHTLSDSGIRLIECYLIGDTVSAYPLQRYPGGIATGPSRQWPRRLTRRPGTY